jgi:hypothetical protein
MIKRRWQGDPGEIIDHLLFTSPIAKMI